MPKALKTRDNIVRLALEEAWDIFRAKKYEESKFHLFERSMTGMASAIPSHQASSEF